MDKASDNYTDSGLDAQGSDAAPPGEQHSVVARADALMQRRRQYGANLSGEPEDLPVLTEIVDPDTDLPAALGENAASPLFDPAVLDILAHELARRMRERLAADLPALVESALQSTLAALNREIEAGLAQTAETAIREFLAEREKLAKLQQQR